MHDAGDYKRDGEWRRLEPGMVLTVEPGCYIRPADSIPARYANIGVRIEDDVLVTATGNEVLTLCGAENRRCHSNRNAWLKRTTSSLQVAGWWVALSRSRCAAGDIASRCSTPGLSSMRTMITGRSHCRMAADYSWNDSVLAVAALCHSDN